MVAEPPMVAEPFGQWWRSPFGITVGGAVTERARGSDGGASRRGAGQRVRGHQPWGSGCLHVGVGFRVRQTLSVVRAYVTDVRTYQPFGVARVLKGVRVDDE